MMRRFKLGLFLGAMVLCGGATRASAKPDLSCYYKVRDNLKACVVQCVDQALESRDVCRNIAPACGNACRVGRTVCVRPFYATLDTCIDGCQTQLASDKGACPPAGDPARDACVDAAQVKAFMCRDTCRENQAVRDGIKACRLAFRACVKACPPAPPVPPTPTPTVAP